MTQQSPRLSPRDTARRISDLYCLWRACGKPGCRRARACRGNGRACLRALALVPAEALGFLEDLDASRGFYSFEEYVARHEEEWQALEDWQRAVSASLPPRAAPAAGRAR